MRVALNLTHRCNLSCDYCYSGESIKDDMTFETATRAINFALAAINPDQILDIGFFGGEPFICFKMMKDITTYLREETQKANIPYQINITSNGTIINQSILDFLYKEQVNLTISIDGPENVHNLNRCFKNGRGSFQSISKNILKFKEHLDFIQVNAVYGPDTLVSLPDTLTFFLDNDLSVIHLNPNITSQWTKEVYANLSEIYMQIGEIYIESFLQGREISVNLIDSKCVIFLKGGYSADDYCGMGETEWGFAPGGNIYPCERLVGEDINSPHCLGNVHVGLDKKRQCALIEARGNRNPECETCKINKYCMNWCGCTNYHMTGHTNLAAPMLCESEKATIMAALNVFQTLKNNELFNKHLMGYLHNGRHP